MAERIELPPNLEDVDMDHLVQLISELTVLINYRPWSYLS
jgi:hypothetical protein